MTVRGDIMRELEQGARLQTYLESKCARGGIDVGKVLARMVVDGDIEVSETAYVMGRFVPIYRLKEKES